MRRVHFLDYPDGKLLWLDHRPVVRKLVKIIREVRPQVLITFGPEGAGNEHRDHRATSSIATRAFFLAGRKLPGLAGGPYSPPKLYYQSWPEGITLVREDVESQPPTTVIDVRPFVETKYEAFLEHKSQVKFDAVFKRVLEILDGSEYFHLAHTDGREPEGLEKCLFEGL